MNINQLSLKSRLIISMATISVFVLGLVIYAQYVNSKTSEYNIHSAQVHNEINQALVKINNILQVLEKEIYEQGIMSDEDMVDSISQTHKILINELTELTTNNSLQLFIDKHAIKNDSNYKILKNLSYKTLSEVETLEPDIATLNGMAVNYLERYPAMSIFENSVLPVNQEIELALEQSLSSSGKGGLTKQQSYVIKMLYQEARYSWFKHIHYVRLFISSRFGAFGKQKKSINKNLHNREIFLLKFESIIIKLKVHLEQEHLDLLQTENLISIIDLLPVYKRNFELGKEIHLSDGWRNDLLVMENQIQPKLDVIWENIVSMQEIVSSQLNESVEMSQSAASKTSTIIWLSVFIILLTLLAIYFVFEFSLRRPIATVARALDDEASGKQDVNITGRFTKEITYLLNAFSNMRKQVHSRQLRLQSILDNAFEGIVITNKYGKIKSFNNAAQSLFEYREDEVIGKDLSMLIQWHGITIHNSDAQSELKLVKSHTGGKKIDATGIKKSMKKFPVSVKVSENVIDGKHNYIASIEDISERKALMDDLEFQAMHDSLTSLYNRRYFTNELNKAIDQYVRGTNNSYAVIYIDLDNFKYVNDTMGHLAGDQLIVEISLLLNARIRKTDVLSRLGGDEFAILLYHKNDIRLEFVAECYRKLIGDYVFKYEGHVVDISCSIGAAYLNSDVDTKEQLLARADFACHESKRLGRNQAYIYTKKNDSQVSDMSRDIGWTRRIKEALLNDSFLLACQPIYNTSKDSVSYYEILIRMVESNNDIIMPFGFLPAAERFGLMLDIDAWVLRNSIRLLAKQQRFNPDIKFSINLSAHSIDNNATYDLIKSEIDKNNIKPESLLFEVTETVAIANLNIAKTFLSNIRALGCKTALDDFGVGYSSFAYLADLPVDIVKIDGFFVKDMESKPLNQIMVRSINDIAHALGKTTVAEFVENENIYRLLKQLNVDYSQGYHLGKPQIVYDENKSIEVDCNTAKYLKRS